MSENIMYKNIADKMKEANEEIEELKAMIEPLKDWKFWEYNCSDEDVKKAMENKSYIEVVLEEQSKTIKELKADNQELQDSITWWNNRYNALQRDYEDYKTRCEKAIEYIKINCITSDKWEDLGFCNLVPTGIIKYKSLSAKKVKEIIDILERKNNE